MTFPRWSLALSPIVVVFFTHAWVTEDAFITFRTVVNILDGYGLRWNIAERVQTFTHPLWMLLLLPGFAVSRSPFLWPLLLSFACTISAVCLLMQQKKSHVDAIVFGLLIASSKAFMDFSSSGLENPLSFLLIALWARDLLSEKPGRLFLWSALLITNRTDYLVLVFPSWVFAIYQNRRIMTYRHIAGILMALSPAAAWYLFALIYYGSPFPNTYYAKLNTGIDSWSYIKQGFVYLQDSLEVDYLTLPLTLASVILARTGPRLIIACGITFYLLYVVKIGGDFMSGRFLAAAFFASLFILKLPDHRYKLHVTLALIVLMSIVNPWSPWRQDHTYEYTGIPPSGIADERGYYFQQFGLINLRFDGHDPHHVLREMGEQWSNSPPAIYPFSNIGVIGFYAGPKAHIVDGYALSDPFLARLPIKDLNSWRIGHFMRVIPQDYLRSLQTRTNHLSSPQLASLYDDMTEITRGPLWTQKRWHAILKRTFGLRKETNHE